MRVMCSREVAPCLVLALFVHGTFNKSFLFDTAWAFSPPRRAMSAFVVSDLRSALALEV